MRSKWVTLKYYLIALQNDPNHINSNIYIGQVYCFQKNDIQKGYPYLKKAMELVGKGGEEPYNLAQTLRILGEYGKAQVYLRSHPNAMGICRAFSIINRIFFTEGNYAKALQYTDSICPLIDCDACNAWYIRLYAYKKEFKKAEQYLKKWEYAKGGARTNAEIGYVYYQLGRRKEAEEYFQAIIKSYEDRITMRTNNPGFHNNVLKIFTFQNKIPEALQTIKKIVKTGRYIDKFDSMIHNPMMKNLLDEPEFIAIFEEVQEKKAAIRAQIKEMEERGEINL